MAEPPLSFYWHDYETFGRSPRRDRPAQFAGLRTDAELNVIGAPLMRHCVPAPDYLPDPESCLLTGITPQQCIAQGVPERQFALEIEAQLAQASTIGVGYNSIRFDDEVTRHLFWRSLIDPYAREWRNGCGRWDLLDVVRCARALRPDGVEWPVHEDGRASFRLEHLTAANGIAHAAAHDALSDVRATIALARLIRARQPRLWDFCLRLRRKEAVLEEIGADRPFLHISGMFPAERGCLAICWPLAFHPTNRNELIVWDLAADPDELFGLDAAQIRERLFTRAELLPEGTTRLAVKTIHVNKAPVVVGRLATLSAPQAERWGLDVPLALQRAELLRTRGAELADRWAAVFERPPLERPDVDEDLYGGFVADADRARLERLRAMDGPRLASARIGFDDSRLEELVFRYRARNFPESLDESDRERWNQHCAARLHEGAGGAQTLAAYFERIDELAEHAAEAEDERAGAILEALYDYAEQIAPERT